MATPSTGDAVPAAQRGSWTSFIKALTSFSGDLYSMTAPPFILSPTSLTEFPAYWNERPEVFAAIADGKTPAERAELVLHWFLSTLKGQYMSRSDALGSEKKSVLLFLETLPRLPLNPVLGEIFRGEWPDKDGRGKSILLVEQVSHHPPITAYWIQNKAKGLTLQGHCAQRTSFSGGSIHVKQVGHATLTIDLKGGKKEKYLITLPKLRIDGLWYGSPYVELTETSNIQSSTGWLSTIEYKGKGYISGTARSFKATLAPNKDGVTGPTTVFEGQWSGLGKRTSSDGDVQEDWLDVRGPKEEVTVGPFDAMTEFETRKLWNVVANGIRTGNYDVASVDKTRIENEARQRRRDEEAAGTTWQLKYFEKLDSDPDYEELGELFGATPETEEVYVYKGPENPLV